MEYKKLKYIQIKYMGEHLRHAVIPIKKTFERCLELYDYKTLELEALWYGSWIKRFGEENPEYLVGIKNLREEHVRSGLLIKDFLNESLIEKYGELTVGFYQTYMMYKIAGIIYEREIIKALRRNHTQVYEAEWLDSMYKTDCNVNIENAVQIKHNKFFEAHANRFYMASKKFKKHTNYFMVCTDGIYKRNKMTGKWDLSDELKINSRFTVI